MHEIRMSRKLHMENFLSKIVEGKSRITINPFSYVIDFMF